MTVRTRKTITDLIQQLKVQEKEIKSQLSDSQRRLNEVRDRISTCYWIIEETDSTELCGSCTAETCEGCSVDESIPYTPCDCFDCQQAKEEEEKQADLEVVSKADWEMLIKFSPDLSFTELENYLRSKGFRSPPAYDGCPCPICSFCSPKKIEKKDKPKKKPVTKKAVKKPTKKGKK